MGSGNTLVVAVDDYSFKQADERNFYACPESYNREKSDFIAFYRVKPVSAITHYAAVKEFLEEDEEFLTTEDRLRMFFDNFDEPATIFILEDLVELETPVECDEGKGIQGATYKDLDRVKSAETVPELL